MLADISDRSCIEIRSGESRRLFRWAILLAEDRIGGFDRPKVEHTLVVLLNLCDLQVLVLLQKFRNWAIDGLVRLELHRGVNHETQLFGEHCCVCKQNRW